MSLNNSSLLDNNVDLLSSFFPDSNLHQLYSDCTDSETQSFYKSSSLSEFSKLKGSIPKVQINLRCASSPNPKSIFEYIQDSSSYLYSVVNKSDSLLVRTIRDGFTAQDISHEAKPVSGLIVCGLKNPYFLPHLIHWAVSRNIKYISFIDTSMDGIVSSLSIIDWSAIRSLLVKHDIRTSFHIHESIAQAASMGIQWLSTFNLYLATNFFYYVDRVCNSNFSLVSSHFNSPITYLALTGKGFYEDNFNMYVNTSRSLSAKDSCFLYKKPDAPTGINVILVASGPSLYENIDELRNICSYPSTYVVACGSALTILLKHNIKPDIALLCERNESVYTKHCTYDQYHNDMRSIPLIAATTVDSRIFPFYKSTYLYKRSSNLFVNSFPDDSVLGFTHPNSLNASFSFALSLKPSSITLFGCDLGSTVRKISRHRDAHGVGSYKFSTVERGNTGTIFTTKNLCLSRDRIYQLYNSDSYQPPVYNRSKSLLHKFPYVEKHILSGLLASSPETKISISDCIQAFPDFSPKLSFCDLRDYLSNLEDSLTITEISFLLSRDFTYSPAFRLLGPLLITATLEFTRQQLLSPRDQDSIKTSYLSFLDMLLLSCESAVARAI